MADTRKYFHWDKTSLRDECCELANSLEQVEEELATTTAQLAASGAENALPRILTTRDHKRLKELNKSQSAG